MFKKGQFVEWKGQDEQGTFTHVGKVVDYSVVNAIIEVSPNGSRITIPQNDGTLREIPEPKDWSLAKPAKEVDVEPIKKTIVRTKSADGSSKKEQAIIIYQSMMVNGQHPARKDVIARFKTELNMTDAGASTYAANCKSACKNACTTV